MDHQFCFTCYSLDCKHIQFQRQKMIEKKNLATWESYFKSEASLSGICPPSPYHPGSLEILKKQAEMAHCLGTTVNFELPLRLPTTPYYPLEPTYGTRKKLLLLRTK